MGKGKKTSSQFEQAIKNYLDDFAKENEFFAEKYKNADKSIEECCNYIIGEVQEMGVQGLADDEVYQLARHYYEENDLGKIKKKNCTVVVNHTIDLTEEEKNKLKEEAKQKFLDEEKERLKKEKEKKIEKEKKAIAKEKTRLEGLGQMSLFDEW